MKKWPLTKKEFEEVYRKVPRLTVEVVVKTDKGIVLTKRSIPPYLGQWHIPGGTVYLGETLEQAVKRVAKEELGVKVEMEKLLGYIEYPNEKKNGGFTQPVGVAFLVRIKSGKLCGSKQGEEVKAFRNLPTQMIVDQRKFLQEKQIFPKKAIF